MAEMSAFLDGLLDGLLSLFPGSPFAPFIDELGEMPYLGYINWFIPIGAMLDIGAAWLTAVTVYYLYSVLARWIKLIS
ncbi:MAG: hypothetical protein NC306_15135 [Butyrivibrio sp.]|nr:hypothetical protein [Butyrivibrio sp.]